jgi:hypothetical protein
MLQNQDEGLWDEKFKAYYKGSTLEINGWHLPVIMPISSPGWTLGTNYQQIWYIL